MTIQNKPYSKFSLFTGKFIIDDDNFNTNKAYHLKPFIIIIVYSYIYI